MPKSFLNGRDEQNKPLLVPDPKLAPIMRWAFETLAGGAMDIESVRRKAGEKGLSIGRSRFWSLMHNMVYCGRVEIGAYKEEGAHYVRGIHEPLISELLFEEVQDILHGRKRITKVRSTKDEHLPLRGFVVCSNCGKPVTGSGANGNGGKYYYYHCQQAAACKERYRADAAHEAFIALLQSIMVKSEVLELYGAIMKQYFKEQGTDRTKETKELQAQIDKLKLRIKNAQVLMLDGELTAAEFKEIRISPAPEIDMLERKKVSVLTAEDDYEQYLEKGMLLLQNIDKHRLAADLAGKQGIVGSIFASKLIFEKNGYRTIGEHPILELISNAGAAFKPSKKGKASTNADLSGWVPPSGRLSNQMLLILKALTKKINGI